MLRDDERGEERRRAISEMRRERLGGRVEDAMGH